MQYITIVVGLSDAQYEQLKKQTNTSDHTINSFLNERVSEELFDKVDDFDTLNVQVFGGE